MTVMDEADVVSDLQGKFAAANERMDEDALTSEARLYPLLEQAGHIHDEWWAEGEEAFIKRVKDAGIDRKPHPTTPWQNYTLQILYGSENKKRKRRISDQAQAMAAYEGLLPQEKIKFGFSMKAWLEHKEWVGKGKNAREIWGIGKGKKLFPKLDWVKVAKAEAKKAKEGEGDAGEGEGGDEQDKAAKETARTAARFRSFQKTLLNPIHSRVIVEGDEGATFIKEHKLPENEWTFAVVDLRGGAVKLLRVLPDKLRQGVTLTLFQETSADEAPVDDDDLREDQAEDQGGIEYEDEPEQTEAEPEPEIEFEEVEPPQAEDRVIEYEDEPEPQEGPAPEPEAPTRSNGFFTETGPKAAPFIEPSFTDAVNRAPEVVPEDRKTERIEQVALTLITKAGKDGCTESEVMRGLNEAGVKANRAEVRRGLVWLEHQKKVEASKTKYFLAGLAPKKRSRK